MDREEYNKKVGHGDWKVGDVCWCEVCCGPVFKILDLTFGHAILNHLPPVAIDLDSIYKSEKEYLEKKLKRVLENKKDLDEQIKEIKVKLNKIN